MDPAVAHVSEPGWGGRGVNNRTTITKSAYDGKYSLGPLRPGDQPHKTYDVPKNASEVNIHIMYIEQDIDNDLDGLLEKDAIWLLINNYLITPAKDLKVLMDSDDPDFPGNDNNIDAGGDLNGTPNADDDAPPGRLLLDFNDGFNSKADLNDLSKPKTKGKISKTLWGSSPSGVAYEVVHWNADCNNVSDTKLDRNRMLMLTIPSHLYAQTDSIDLKLFIRKDVPGATDSKSEAAASIYLKSVRVKYSVKNFFAVNVLQPKNQKDEDATFEIFKLFTESRMREFIVKAISDAFYMKKGHCFENTIPLVSVTLVGKKKWNEAKPRCS